MLLIKNLFAICRLVLAVVRKKKGSLFYLDMHENYNTYNAQTHTYVSVHAYVNTCIIVYVCKCVT